MNVQRMDELKKELHIQWGLEWTEQINTSELKIFPIQFANVLRLEHNKVVYIFDEVGTGKTISSGLMAWHYLASHPDRRVLVITTPAMAGRNGQFVGDWRKRLGFHKEELLSRVCCINNVACNVSRIYKPEQYGMVIIDEAHLFLNRETERFQGLCTSGLAPERLVFLTATPIKNDWENDRKSYLQIADALVEGYSQEEGQEAFRALGRENPTICESFDPKLPVTRYFKEVFEYLKLDGENGFDTRIDCVKRNPAEIWNYREPFEEPIRGKYSEKHRRLLHGIREELKKHPENKFVVFTNFVSGRDGADYLGKMFDEQDDFVRWDPGVSKEGAPKHTFYVVTGENKQELSLFDPKNLKKNEGATVLIVNRQVAEQGVNLHSCNRIINYHISSWPASLEQRFGRVDRIGSQYREVTMCYLVGDWMDSSTMNFYYAIEYFKSQIIQNLPSRNVILDENTINAMKDFSQICDGFRERVKRLKKSMESPLIVQRVREVLLQQKEPIVEDVDDRIRELFTFCLERKQYLDLHQEAFAGSVADLLRDAERDISGMKVSRVEYSEEIARLGNQIFYLTGENQLKVVSAQRCAENIKGAPDYQSCKELIAGLVELPSILSNPDLLEYLNQKTLEAISGNRFEDIFPPDGYKRLFSRLLPMTEMKQHIEKGYYRSENERKLILEHTDQILSFLIYYQEIAALFGIWRNTKRQDKNNGRSTEAEPLCHYLLHECMDFIVDSEGFDQANFFMKLFYVCFRYPNPHLQNLLSQSEFREWEENCAGLLEVMGNLSDDLSDREKTEMCRKKEELKEKLQKIDLHKLRRSCQYNQFNDIFCTRKRNSIRGNIEAYCWQTGHALGIFQKTAEGEGYHYHPDLMTIKILCAYGRLWEGTFNEEEYRQQMIRQYHLESDPEIYDLLRPYFVC